MDATKAIGDAYHLCKKHGLYFITKQQRRDPAVPGDYVEVYIVYREVPGEKHGTRLGRRRNAAALLTFVRQLTGETVKKPETAPA